LVLIKQDKLERLADIGDELYMLPVHLHISNQCGLCFIYFLKFYPFYI